MEVCSNNDMLYNFASGLEGMPRKPTGYSKAGQGSRRRAPFWMLNKGKDVKRVRKVWRSDPHLVIQ